MNTALGIIIGVILGIFCAIGATLYGLTSSNIIGTQSDDAEHFVSDDAPVTYHVKQDTFKGKRSV